MRIVTQRVTEAKVKIKGKAYSEIGKGLLIFLGIENGDTRGKAEWLARKICNLRVFPDNEAKMNLSVKDIHGEVLVVSQFTLAAYVKKGNRPSFSNAANEGDAVPLYEYFVNRVSDEVQSVKTGVFGADMQIELINNGPVTFIIER